MPTTPLYSLAYPSPDDLGGDFPADLADLAADIDAALGAVAPDSGVLGSLGLSVAAGWTVTTNQHRTIGKWLFFNLRFQRTGADLPAADAGGNISDQLVATITDPAKRPAMVNWVGLYRASFTGGGALINGASGNLTLTSAHSTSVIQTSHNVIVGGRYSIA